ncbi:hypothetical protein, conserved [Babesia bigemina]|uniref:Uncharacterized protein n=1 Tax=Babesia bigemina TaxID=5866 RepID=A0A061D946_BABBI|nr:hypothetical protein, conserved [Babesia bigemina]CDR94245.1 hypothetical protein, conserved [Babesia bigemina]|eukprot:XP_012766431.1 hypothetical protein, conserved [Babesia bigemina]
MDSDSAVKLPPIYVHKGKKVRTDVLTRQALVPPIFRRRESLKREARYSKVHSSDTSGEIQASANEAYCNALYLRYQTDFNYLSPELVLNKKVSGNTNIKSVGTETNKEIVSHLSNGKRRRTKSASSDSPDSVPTSPWLNRMLPILLKVMSGRDGDSNDISSIGFKEEVLQLYKTGQKFEECNLRDVATVLSSIVSYIDDWRASAQIAISQRITIEEARGLMEEFQELSGGLVRVDLATEIDNDIKICEAFGAKVRLTMTTLSSSNDRTVSLEEVESLVQESSSCRFLVPEVVALQSIFRNLISLRSLMETSVLDLDLSECESLVSICEKGLVRLPRLDELRRRLQESVWLHTASKACQRQVRYSLAKSLIDNVPDVLRDHRLYVILKKKCHDVEQWMERISKFSFYQMVSNEVTYSGLLSKKDVSSQSPVGSGSVVGVKCDARTFEEICSAYHQLELTLPIFRSIEPLCQSLKRLQRRLHKIEVVLQTNSRNPSVATDCLLLLQHAEPLSEIIDLTEYLEPIRSGVELWLNYEKRCRKVLDSVKAFVLSKDFNKLKSDWGFLLNFRKTTKLSDADFIGIADLIRLYEQEDRVPFEDVRQLEAEFRSLRIKNLVLQREISEIYEKGVTLNSKVDSAFDSVKEDVSKSGSVLSHVVLVILEVLKFGAKLDSMPKLRLCLSYLRWSREFYTVFFSTTAMLDGGSRLRTLAAEGADDRFNEITSHAGLHESITNQLNKIGCLSIGNEAPRTESQLLIMPTIEMLSFSSQVYNIDVSFFVELRRRIIDDFRCLRSELQIHAFAAVDGALWLDKGSFDNVCCRFKDCSLSFSSTATRYGVERAQLLSRRTAKAHKSPSCDCARVPGTLITLPTLSEFRAIDLQSQVERACGTLVTDDGGLRILGVRIDDGLWRSCGGFSGIGNLRRLVIIIYMDIKACVCYYAISSPAANPAGNYSISSCAVLNASGRFVVLKGTPPKQLMLDDVSTLTHSFCASPVPYGFFAFGRCDGKLVVSNMSNVHVVDEFTIELEGTACSSNDVTFCGFGNLSPVGSLPRHWCSAMLALCHLLKLYGKKMRFMLIDISTSTRSIIRDRCSLAVIYEVVIGGSVKSGGKINFSYGYHIASDNRLNDRNLHENAYNFSDRIDSYSRHRIDAELHLQMMKWKVIPQLNPDNITMTNICVIGAGALGCHIIRQFLAWGARNFVVIDYAKVTNATRQCLFNSRDSIDQAYKATLACQEIKRIRPDADAIPVNMFVPMPGMFFGLSSQIHHLVGHFIYEEDLRASYTTLTNIMLKCDVVFLATDSKESRWLPSLIGAAHRFHSAEVNSGVLDEANPNGELRENRRGPLVISTGLTFDTFMVIRHGYGGFYGGCYFCSDVQWPEDSISSRPVDETCTLVKPGSVAMCAAAAVELFISLTQHPRRFEAPHNGTSCIGGVPHAMHMSLSGKAITREALQSADMHVDQFYVEASKRCVCCSDAVIKKLKSNAFDFLHQVVRTPSILGEISGLNRTLSAVAGYDMNTTAIEDDFVLI